MSKLIDLTGQKFSRLTVVGRAPNAGTQNITMWHCVCECGSTKIIDGHSLKRGKSKSCGCLMREASAKRVYRHGLTDSSTHGVWLSMRQRCKNANEQSFKNYGGRGITVCERWESFENFLADMGEKPDGMSIDRIDNNKGYSPDNCRWATAQMQNTNKRNNISLTLNGVTKCLSEWAETNQISVQTLHSRINKLGWPVERALTEPSRSKAKARHST